MKSILILDGMFNRAAMQAGAMMYLYEQGIKVDEIIATSFGAINGAFFASSPDIHGLKKLNNFWASIKEEDIIHRTFVDKLLGRNPNRIHFKAFKEKLQKYIPHLFEVLEIPLKIVLYNEDEASPVIVDSGDLVEAIMDAIYIPEICIERRANLSGILIPNLLYELAIEEKPIAIYTLMSDYESLLEYLPSAYEALLKLNMRYIEKFASLGNRLIEIKFHSETSPFDFKDTSSLFDHGYKLGRKQYVEHRLLRLGRVGEALNLLQRPDLLFEEKVLKAYTLYLHGNVKQAEEMFLQVSSEKRSLDDLNFLQGYAYLLMDKGNLEESERLLERALEISPKDPFVHDTFSRLYFFKGDIESSINSLKLAISYAQENGDYIAYNLALNHLGINMHLLGNFQEAYRNIEESARNLVALDHAYYASIALNNLAKFYIDMGLHGHIENIVKVMEEMTNLSGSDRTKMAYYSTLANFLVPMDFERSIEYEKEAIRIASENEDINMLASLLYSISTRYLSAGMYDKAEMYAKEALDISKEHNLHYPYEGSLYNLIFLYTETERFEEVRKLLEEVKQQSFSPNIKYRILPIEAYLNYREGKEYKHILEEFLNVLRSTPNKFYFLHMPNNVEKLFKEYAGNLSISQIKEIGLENLLRERIESDPKEFEEFLRILKPEESVKYMDVIRKADTKRFGILVSQFAQYWYLNLKQKAHLFGKFLYMVDVELVPQDAFGDELNRLILFFLILNRGHTFKFGNISTTFGVHSEAVEERLKFLQGILEPWTITEKPKYLIIMEDEFVFRTDENFQTDIYEFDKLIQSEDVEDLEKAFEIYTGDLLEDVQHYYFEQFRTSYRNKYKELVYKLASKHAQLGNVERAINILESLLVKDINNEEHLKFLIKLLYERGKRAYAYEWYLKYLASVERETFQFQEALEG